MLIYSVLDIAFFVFHTALVLFVLFGWTWKRTHRAHLVTIVVVTFSWTVLGIWYGLGFCPCTEWHWQVRAKLGHTNMPTSYLKFLLDKLTGVDAPATWVHGVAVVALGLVFMLSARANVRHRNNETASTQR